MDNKNPNSPFGKHHGPHQDQMRDVDHRHRRKAEKREDRNWERETHNMPNIIREVDNINAGEFVCQNCARILTENNNVYFYHYGTTIGICRVCGNDGIDVASPEALGLNFFMSRSEEILVVNRSGKLWSLDYD